jgi:hypothetical protein
MGLPIDQPSQRVEKRWVVVCKEDSDRGRRHWER